jgi:hypothetical protein
MNTDTGQLYLNQPDIEAARQRGESLAMVGPKVVKLIRLGQSEASRRKTKRKMAKDSKRRNRQ